MILEIDYLGKIYGRYNIPYGYHHDVAELQNGNLIVATNDFFGTIEDIIIENEKSNEDVLDNESDNESENESDNESDNESENVSNSDDEMKSDVIDDATSATISEDENEKTE